MGTALILGSAPGAKDDLMAAIGMRPLADLIAVKFSVALAECKLAVTHHPDHASPIKAAHRAAWGSEIEVHMPQKQIHGAHAKDIDRVWDKLAGVGGTSGWGAARLALLLGYDEVILCGCPLDNVPAGAPVHDEEVVEAAKAAGVKPGRGEPWSNTAAVAMYRRYVQSDIDRGIARNVRSMSGWTQKVLGAPNV